VVLADLYEVYMQIGKLAKKTQTGRATLDRYARMGLIPCIENSKNGYRDFSEEVIDRLQLIHDLRKKPFRLDLEEIKQIFGAVPLDELQSKRRVSKQTLLLHLITLGLM
jgi:DNA-binding transcriptional MerR regulator